jgi:hypothetical protein
MKTSVKEINNNFKIDQISDKSEGFYEIYTLNTIQYLKLIFLE